MPKSEQSPEVKQPPTYLLELCELLKSETPRHEPFIVVTVSLRGPLVSFVMDFSGPRQQLIPEERDYLGRQSVPIATAH